VPHWGLLIAHWACQVHQFWGSQNHHLKKKWSVNLFVEEILFNMFENTMEKISGTSRSLYHKNGRLEHIGT
jgi:hypothetical protein